MQIALVCGCMHANTSIVESYEEERLSHGSAVFLGEGRYWRQAFRNILVLGLESRGGSKDHTQVGPSTLQELAVGSSAQARLADLELAQPAPELLLNQ